MMMKKFLTFFNSKKSKFFRKRNKKNLFIYKVLMGGSVYLKGKVNTNQKVVLKGLGTISIGNNVSFGYETSPQFRCSECYIEARNSSSEIIIGENVFFNNGCSLIADKSTISIGDNTIIGPNFTCLGSNFHSLDPKKRNGSDYSCKPISIGKNVFIGANVTVLQGVTIGDNSVIGAGCVVTKSIGENMVARPPELTTVELKI